MPLLWVTPASISLYIFAGLVQVYNFWFVIKYWVPSHLAMLSSFCSYFCSYSMVSVFFLFCLCWFYLLFLNFCESSISMWGAKCIPWPQRTFYHVILICLAVYGPFIGLLAGPLLALFTYLYMNPWVTPEQVILTFLCLLGLSAAFLPIFLSLVLFVVFPFHLLSIAVLGGYMPLLLSLYVASSILRLQLFALSSSRFLFYEFWWGTYIPLLYSGCECVFLKLFCFRGVFLLRCGPLLYVASGVPVDARVILGLERLISSLECEEPFSQLTRGISSGSGKSFSYQGVTFFLADSSSRSEITWSAPLPKNSNKHVITTFVVSPLHPEDTSCKHLLVSHYAYGPTKPLANFPSLASLNSSLTWESSLSSSLSSSVFSEHVTRHSELISSIPASSSSGVVIKVINHDPIHLYLNAKDLLYLHTPIKLQVPVNSDSLSLATLTTEIKDPKLFTFKLFDLRHLKLLFSNSVECKFNLRLNPLTSNSSFSPYFPSFFSSPFVHPTFMLSSFPSHSDMDLTVSSRHCTDSLTDFMKKDGRINSPLDANTFKAVNSILLQMYHDQLFNPTRTISFETFLPSSFYIPVKLLFPTPSHYSYVDLLLQSTPESKNAPGHYLLSDAALTLLPKLHFLGPHGLSSPGRDELQQWYHFIGDSGRLEYRINMFLTHRIELAGTGHIISV